MKEAEYINVIVTEKDFVGIEVHFTRAFMEQSQLDSLIERLIAARALQFPLTEVTVPGYTGDSLHM